MLGKGSVLNKQRPKVLKLVDSRHLTEQKQVHNLLKAETVVGCNSVNYVLNVVTSVKKLAVARYKLAVNQLVLLDCRDVGKSGQNALSVNVAQAALYVVVGVQIGVNNGVLRHFVGKTVDNRGVIGVVPSDVIHNFTSFHDVLIFSEITLYHKIKNKSTFIMRRLFFQNADNFADIHSVPVVAFIKALYGVVLSDKFIAQILSVKLFAHKHKPCLLKVGSAFLGKRRGKSGFGRLVDVAAALASAKAQSLAVAFVVKADCKNIVLLQKLVGVSLWTDKCKRNGLVPHNAYAAPTDCHCVKAVLCAACDKSPVLADKLKRIVINFFG